MHSGDRILIRQSRIDVALKASILLMLFSWNLYFSQYSILAGHTLQGSLFHDLSYEYYWNHMANDVCTTGANWQRYAAQATKQGEQQQLRLLLATRPLKIVLVKFGVHYHFDNWTRISSRVGCRILYEDLAIRTYLSLQAATWCWRGPCRSQQ